MRPVRTALAALACLALTTSCTTPQFGNPGQLPPTASHGGLALRAQYLGATAMATQFALAHIATALAELASKDFNGGTATAVGTLKGDMDTTYRIDAAAGTGRVTSLREGKTVVDLTFAFGKEQLGSFTTYRVRDVRGAMEGFDLSMPLMSITYAPQQKPDGTPILDPSGKQAFFAMAESAGALNYQGAPFIVLPKTVLSVLYPVPDDVKVGRISATQDGLTFDGDVTVTNGKLKGLGTIVDNDGGLLFSLTASGGQIEMTPHP